MSKAECFSRDNWWYFCYYSLVVQKDTEIVWPNET